MTIAEWTAWSVVYFLVGGGLGFLINALFGV